MSWNPSTVAEQLLYCVKRIECELGGGRRSVGTGYICLAPNSAGAAIPLLVTNKHVLDGAERIRICMHTAADKDGSVPDGKIVYVEAPSILVPLISHDNPDIDLCAILLGPFIHLWKQQNSEKGLYYRGLAEDQMSLSLDALDVCETVTMVGCPNGLWDQWNGFPLFRRGHTATRLATDFDGKPEFVVDVAVFSGSSGSPIMLMDNGAYTTRDRPTELKFGRRVGLLGTLWGGPRISEVGKVEIKPVPTSMTGDAEVNVRMHLGYAIKASETLHLLKKAASEYGDVGPDDLKSITPLKKVTDEEIKRTFGRNAPCICGSGLRYKRCHGRLTNADV